MAAALLGRALAERGRLASVTSAGTLGWSGRPATTLANEVMAELGLDIGHHVSRRLSADLVVSADVVIAMTRQHAWAVKAWDSDAAARTFLAAELVRLIRRVGAPGELPVRDWVGRVDSARPSAFPVGRASDEIDDPAGHPIAVYRSTRDRLCTVIDPLAALLEPGLSPYPRTD